MQAHVFVSGFVQGVGFRQFVKKTAIRLNLKGWVKNLPDGRVEAIFQGDKNSIEKMIEECDKGPFLAEVKNIVVEWSREAGSRSAGEDIKIIYMDFKIL